MIDEVTSDDVAALVRRMLEQLPSVVYFGDAAELETLPNAEMVHEYAAAQMKA